MVETCVHTASWETFIGFDKSSVIQITVYCTSISTHWATYFLCPIPHISIVVGSPYTSTSLTNVQFWQLATLDSLQEYSFHHTNLLFDLVGEYISLLLSSTL